MIRVSKEVSHSIMSTDIYLEIQCEKSRQIEAENDIEYILDMFREFENKFSRFISHNELKKFNNSYGNIQVSSDMKALLEESLKFHELTRGVFDISSYHLLLERGYRKSFTSEKIDEQEVPSEFIRLDQMKIEKDFVYKPKGLIIEFGGIGKSWIARKAKKYLLDKGYENFLIDAGGDIIAQGADVVGNNEFWPIDIESSGIMLMLKDSCVATSGITKRTWLVEGKQMHHLTDVSFKELPIEEQIHLTTVISDDIVMSDVMAKTCLLLKKTEGLKLADELGFAILMSTYDNKWLSNQKASDYIWNSAF